MTPTYFDAEHAERLSSCCVAWLQARFKTDRTQFVCFVPQKQRPKRVKAIYNCVADNPDELTFSEGEVIVVDGEEDQEWWVSICGTES